MTKTTAAAAAAAAAITNALAPLPPEKRAAVLAALFIGMMRKGGCSYEEITEYVESCIASRKDYESAQAKLS
jgi:DNA-directed RNA polymerase specialized sigma24 family protein